MKGCLGIEKCKELERKIPESRRVRNLKYHFITSIQSRRQGCYMICFPLFCLFLSSEILSELFFAEKINLYKRTQAIVSGYIALIVFAVFWCFFVLYRLSCLSFRVVLKQAVLTEVPVYMTRKTRHFHASKNLKQKITLTSKQVRLGNRFHSIESNHVQLLRHKLLDRALCTQISHDKQVLTRNMHASFVVVIQKSYPGSALED